MFGYTQEVLLVDMLSSVGRFIEYKLTGQSEYRLMVPFEGARTVNTDLEGKLQLDEVRKKLWSEFSVKTRWPVLLEVKAPPPAGWKAGFYHSEGNMGRYQVNVMGSEKSHQVTVRPNLATPVFRAILAHELVHVRQYAEAGFVVFLTRYLRDYVRGLIRLRNHRRAYLAIPSEVEARAEARAWKQRR